MQGASLEAGETGAASAVDQSDNSTYAAQLQLDTAPRCLYEFQRSYAGVEESRI